MVSITNKRSRDYTISKQQLSRNTIVDLLEIVGGSARPGYLICDVDMSYTSLLLKKLYNRGVKTTVTALLIKAIGIAQRYHTVSRTESLPLGSLVTYNNIVAGFTVERIVDGQPTVFLGEINHPDLKSIEQISNELKHYANAPIDEIEPIRLQQLLSHCPAFVRRLILIFAKCFPALRLKCQKASFGLTSLGKFGVSALLSPCLCSSTFGIGELEERPVVIDNQIEIKNQMTISLNFDLRAFDYAEAADFLNTVCMLLEGKLEPLWNEKENVNLKTNLTSPSMELVS